MDRFATVVPRIPGIFVALVKYLSLLLFPFGTHMNYGLKFFSFFDPNVLAAAIIVAVLIIYTIKKKEALPAFIFFSRMVFRHAAARFKYLSARFLHGGTLSIPAVLGIFF